MRVLVVLALLAACAPRPQPPRLSAQCTARVDSFGCSAATNLAATADPADLARGRRSSPAPAMLDAAAIDRLRTGKTAPLIGAGASDGFQRQGGPQ